MYSKKAKFKVRHNFAKLRKSCEELFYYGSEVDSWLLEMCLIPYITISWNTTPTWLRIIAPSSSGKSAHLALLTDHCQSVVVDDMTPKSLLSGFRGGGSDVSHLPTFNNKVLVIQDESTMMEQRAEDRGIIQALLRKAFDGKLSKIFGNIEGVVEAEAHFNFLVAATPIIDRYFSYTQTLGERFINFRLQIPHPDKITKRAFLNQQNNYPGRHELLKEKVHAFLNDFPVVDITDIKVSQELQDRLTACADFIVRIRTHIARDITGKHITMLPRSESAGRLVQQLLQVASACTAVNGHSIMTDEYLDRAIYTAISSVPDIVLYSLYIINNLSNEKIPWFNVQSFVVNTGIGRNTATQLLENFCILKLLDIRKGESSIGRSMEYTLNSETKELINHLGVFRHYLPPSIKVKIKKNKHKDKHHKHKSFKHKKHK